jgi:hypothetical protein
MPDTHVMHACFRIGTCRKKVMGLLRLMGNKADVVKGLAKRCNENWSVAPKSDIVSPPPVFPSLRLVKSTMLTRSRFIGTVSLGYSRSFDHHDPELEPLRKDSESISFELPRTDLDRNDRRE